MVTEGSMSVQDDGKLCDCGGRSSSGAVGMGKIWVMEKDEKWDDRVCGLVDEMWFQQVKQSGSRLIRLPIEGERRYKITVCTVSL